MQSQLQARCVQSSVWLHRGQLSPIRLSALPSVCSAKAMLPCALMQQCSRADQNCNGGSSTDCTHAARPHLSQVRASAGLLRPCHFQPSRPLCPRCKQSPLQSFKSARRGCRPQRFLLRKCSLNFPTPSGHQPLALSFKISRSPSSIRRLPHLPDRNCSLACLAADQRDHLVKLDIHGVLTHDGSLSSMFLVPKQPGN